MMASRHELLLNQEPSKTQDTGVVKRSTEGHSNG